MTESRSQQISVAQAMRIALECHQAGRLPEAERLYRQILQFEPRNAEPHFGLADVLSGLGQIAEAAHWYRLGIGFDPARPIAHFNLANMLKLLGRLEEAELEFQQALALKPDYVEAHNNRGIVLTELGRLDDAAASYRRAIAIKPDHAVAYNNLGNVFRELGRHEEAERYYRQTVALKPGLAEALNHHGNALLDLGRLDEAERSYRRAIALAPELAMAHDNLLLLQNYLPGPWPDGIGDDALAYARLFERTAAPLAYAGAVDPSRKLRIGYVSGDFRVHSVAFFIEPILAAHERSAFEVFCYHNFPRADAVTQRLKSHVDHWRDVHALDDAALAGRIRSDAIDILVDLSGHTAYNRLPVFAVKPAPVQLSYLGYPASTGLSAIDFRLTDVLADPPGASDRQYAERLVRLPRAMWCFRPDARLAQAKHRPARKAGKVNFGSFNYFAKLNPGVIALWARLLARLPEATLAITRIPGQESAAVLSRRFESLGIASNRVALHGIVSRAQLAELFDVVDIALDPFPYAGTTTTCEVLWMGIPVVTLAGATTASRSGASLLHAVGLDTLVARSADEYLDIAESLARNLDDLNRLRGSLRERMRSSALTDPVAFTRDLEGVFRDLWRTWCRGGGGRD